MKLFFPHSSVLTVRCWKLVYSLDTVMLFNNIINGSCHIGDVAQLTLISCYT